MNNNFSYSEINEVLLKKKNRYLVDNAFSSNGDNAQIVLSICRNIEDLGFVFSRKLFDVLRYQSQDNLVESYKQLVFVITKMVGSHVEHKPFYKNFPQQLASLPELDLYMNALVHYWTNGQWMPDYVNQLRFPVEDGNLQIHIIDLGSISDFDQIFIDMATGRGSLSIHDQELLGWYIQKASSDDLIKRLPETIPAKETLSLVISKILEFHPEKHDLVTKYIKTATDILRLVTSLSGGDTSLASNTHFRNFTRPERRLILSLLDDCRNIEEDMGRYPGKWICIGEKLHPGDYSNQFPVAYEAFKKIRNGEDLYSFAAEVEKALKKDSFEKVLRLLEQRPGELARRMDFLARAYPQINNDLIDSFANIAGQISSQVLLQLIAHFKNRNLGVATRAFFPKGNIAKVQVVEKTLSPLSEYFCNQIVSICELELIKQFKSKPPLGKVYINPVLKDIYVPLAQRSSDRSLKTYARGSRFVLGNNVQTIRAFIHWKNILLDEKTTGYYLDQKHEEEDIDFDGNEISTVESIDRDQTNENTAIRDWRDVLSESNVHTLRNGADVLDPNIGKSNLESTRQIRTDIDLSLGLYDAEWNYIEHISYTNLRSNDLEGLYHSGDIVTAPEGASEFIDMDIKVLQEKKVRYAVFNIYSYTEQGFNEIPECFFGWMNREKPESGEIYEPKTVVNKIDLTSPTTVCLPVLFDLEELKVIWMDVALRSNPNWVNNIEANSNNVVLISKAMVELKKPNLFDLFLLNIQARGELVDTPEKAEKRFGIDESDDVTPFQVETILSEFL